MLLRIILLKMTYKLNIAIWITETKRCIHTKFYFGANHLGSYKQEVAAFLTHLREWTYFWSVKCSKEGPVLILSSLVEELLFLLKWKQKNRKHRLCMSMGVVWLLRTCFLFVHLSDLLSSLVKNYLN